MYPLGRKIPTLKAAGKKTSGLDIAGAIARTKAAAAQASDKDGRPPVPGRLPSNRRLPSHGRSASGTLPASPRAIASILTAGSSAAAPTTEETNSAGIVSHRNKTIVVVENDSRPANARRSVVGAATIHRSFSLGVTHRDAAEIEELRASLHGEDEEEDDSADSSVDNSIARSISKSIRIQALKERSNDK